MPRKPYTERIFRQLVWGALQRDDADSIMRILHDWHMVINSQPSRFGHRTCSAAECLLLTKRDLWNEKNTKMRTQGYGLLEVCIANRKLQENGAPNCARAVADRMMQLATQGDLNFVEEWSKWARRRLERPGFPGKLHACRSVWAVPLLDNLDTFVVSTHGSPPE